MTGVRMKFGFDDRSLHRDLRRRIGRLENKEPLLKIIGQQFAGANGIINGRFQQERGPDGKKWSPLSSRTIEKRLKKFGNSPLTILRAEGFLAGSFAYQTTSSSVSIGVKAGSDAEPYAAIHQFGGKAGRGRKVTIKARPYMGFADDDMAIIEEEIVEFLSNE